MRLFIYLSIYLFIYLSIFVSFFLYFSRALSLSLFFEIDSILYLIHGSRTEGGTTRISCSSSFPKSAERMQLARSIISTRATAEMTTTTAFRHREWSLISLAVMASRSAKTFSISCSAEASTTRHRGVPASLTPCSSCTPLTHLSMIPRRTGAAALTESPSTQWSLPPSRWARRSHAAVS